MEARWVGLAPVQQGAGARDEPLAQRQGVRSGRPHAGAGKMRGTQGGAVPARARAENAPETAKLEENLTSILDF